MNPLEENTATLQQERERLTPQGESSILHQDSQESEEEPTKNDQHSRKDPSSRADQKVDDWGHQQEDIAQKVPKREGRVTAVRQGRTNNAEKSIVAVREGRGNRMEQQLGEILLHQFPVKDMQHIQKKLFEPIYSLAGFKIQKLLTKEQGKIQLSQVNFSIQVSCKSEAILKRVSEAIDTIVSTFNCSLIIADKMDLKKLYNSDFLREELQGDGMMLYYVFEQKKEQLYIGGSVEEHLLRVKVSKLKRLVIDECILSQYPSTRSYETLIREVFKLPELLFKLKDTYRLETIELVRKDRDEPARDLLCRFICNPTPNLAINKLSIFITETIDKYAICPALVFRSTISKQTIPSFAAINNVCLLIINETKLSMSYLYVVATRKGLQEGMEQVIGQISKLEQKFIGVRYFKGLHPQKQPSREDQIETVFPSVRPYSWTVIQKEFAELDWRQYLKSCVN